MILTFSEIMAELSKAENIFPHYAQVLKVVRHIYYFLVMAMAYELQTYIFGKYPDYLETYLECCAATTSPTVRGLLRPILTATTNNMLLGSSSSTMSSSSLGQSRPTAGEN